MKGTFLQANWENLIMANYAVDAAVLQPYLPAHTVLDSYNEKIYVSLVGFMFLNTRMLGFRIPFHINFEEVNLRFYVRHNDNGVWKRGVVFIREIVPKTAISLVANLLYREKYSRMPMRSFTAIHPEEIDILYEWKYRKIWNKLGANVSSHSISMDPESEEAFIAEHYFGYSRYSAAKTFEYAVGHLPWQLYPVNNYSIICDFEGLYGKQFAFLKDAEPTSVFVAKGSEVTVSDKRTL